MDAAEMVVLDKYLTSRSLDTKRIPLPSHPMTNTPSIVQTLSIWDSELNLAWVSASSSIPSTHSQPIVLPLQCIQNQRKSDGIGPNADSNSFYLDAFATAYLQSSGSAANAPTIYLRFDSSKHHAYCIW